MSSKASKTGKVSDIPQIPATTEEESSRDTNDTSTSKNAEIFDYVDLENQASWGTRTLTKQPSQKVSKIKLSKDGVSSKSSTPIEHSGLSLYDPVIGQAQPKVPAPQKFIIKVSVNSIFEIDVPIIT